MTHPPVTRVSNAARRNSELLSCVAWCLAGGVTWSACERVEPRDVTLVATGVAFVLAGDPGTMNPALTFQPGERVRLILTNDAPGMRHDVAIPAWNVAVDPIAFGERAEVTFTVPSAGGSVDYHCRPHATMMRGVVDVAPIVERAAR
jgi:plastocyanin